jgi:hypothetical protein
MTWGDFDAELGDVSFGTESPIYSNAGMPELPLLPQNPTPTLNGEDIVNRATKILEKDYCARFIKKLITTANGLSNRSDTPDILSILKTVQSQGGFVYGNTILDYYKQPGGTIHGSLTDGTAQIEFPFPPPFNLDPSKYSKTTADIAESRARSNAQTAIHEAFHLAGYDDILLMKAAAKARNLAEPDFSRFGRDVQIIKASTWWSSILEGFCY